jgi:hypothetical protein
MNRTVKIVLGVVLVLAVAAGSFFGGMMYGKSQAQTTRTFRGFDPANAPQGFGGQGVITSGQDGATQQSGRPGGGSGRGGMLAGEIVSVNGGDVTIKDADGKEIVVHVTDSTLIQKQAEVTVGDLAAGDTVFVSGSKGDDGSYTARSVQVSSGGAFGMGLPGAMPPGAQPGTAAATPAP